MATYYINPAGSSTWPFDTSAKGASTLAAFVAGFTGVGETLDLGDIVEVLSGTITVTTNQTIPISTNFGDRTNPGGPLFRSHSANATKPIFLLNADAQIYLPINSSAQFSRLIFNKQGPVSNNIIQLEYGNNRIDIDSCVFRIFSDFALFGGPAIAIGNYTASTAVATNCIFKDIPTYGISTAGAPGIAKVYNCVFDNVGFREWGWPGNQGSLQCYDGCTVVSYNNVFVDSSGNCPYVFLTQSSVTANYNDYYGYASEAAVYNVHGGGGYSASNNLYIDPQWTNPATLDYHMAADNPCQSSGRLYTDIGYSVLPSGDYLGATRTVRAMGIYEPVSPPVANFSASICTGVYPLSVPFTDSTTNTPTGWYWEFGDGDTSGDQNPTHVYDATGVYDVLLLAYNTAGTDQITRSNYITVTGHTPVAAFTGLPLGGVVPLDVSFTESSTYNPTGWYWTFGDGAVSSLRNPSHTYSSIGIYTVSLVVSNIDGSSTLTRTEYITAVQPISKLTPKLAKPRITMGRSVRELARQISKETVSPIRKATKK